MRKERKEIKEIGRKNINQIRCMETEIDAVTRIAMNVYSNKGVYVPLLGSGVSLSAGIMSGWKVTEDLLKKLAFMKEGATI